ncbi:MULTISPECIES: 2,3-bisphosphoglycerate-independent phosphoglycerate mutase [unclassified Acidocella]|uniref:2,3-bisphosphoglycerate-independent phosphoglycerate mutase n=1 Tax=unclassified Acidocella TaxID=2648610 RepID=UPI00028EE9D0|nr:MULTISPECIES: 2,3-bisphosphoglycerate-independent phosphoglycerate mutase [unclassified Acidocella]EKN00944.1 phosphoglyceromutase [Acidocella sp. MX-AZ02]WBO60485.1 2,3-bisphosphoglycerate-independent phosphoglycerate mutase [Acidocella sp. MX-AZ03]
MAKKPVMLVILDGFGWNESPQDNAVAQANTPHFDALWETCPRAFLTTSGRVVGLPSGQMGNSEVGHLNIGAGRTVMQDLPRIDAAIEDGALARNETVQGFIAALKKSGGTAHLLGLVSPGGVHSHQDHAVALAKILHEAGIPVIAHGWMDGRDTPPQAGLGYMEKFLAGLGESAKLGTLVGRYYAMDRDKRWERVQQAYELLVDAKGAHFPSAEAAIQASYEAKITDEFIKPAVIGDYGGIKDGDGVICANYRADRVREILTALLDPSFDGFQPRQPKLVGAVGMTAYSDALAPFMQTIFAPQRMDDLLGGIVSKAGLKQLRMAETEKYPHVTYFFNGGMETPFPGEERIMVPSPKVATYDLQPEMSAPELTEKAVAAIKTGTFDMIILNFANPDMVGHTGSLPAAIKAVETVDAGLGKIWAAVQAQGGAILVTADHGNCEMMRDPETGGPHTAHTTNPVPVLIAGGPAGIKLHDGILADIAPTLLKLMGVAQPPAMTGKPLFG